MLSTLDAAHRHFTGMLVSILRFLGRQLIAGAHSLIFVALPINSDSNYFDLDVGAAAQRLKQLVDRSHPNKVLDSQGVIGARAYKFATT